jgi:hypothetical protein
VGRNTDTGYGESFADGNTVPAWLRHNPEFREVYEARFCWWNVMA